MVLAAVELVDDLIACRTHRSGRGLPVSEVHIAIGLRCTVDLTNGRELPNVGVGHFRAARAVGIARHPPRPTVSRHGVRIEDGVIAFQNRVEPVLVRVDAYRVASSGNGVAERGGDVAQHAPLQRRLGEILQIEVYRVGQIGRLDIVFPQNAQHVLGLALRRGRCAGSLGRVGIQVDAYVETGSASAFVVGGEPVVVLVGVIAPIAAANDGEGDAVGLHLIPVDGTGSAATGVVVVLGDVDAHGKRAGH